MGPLVARRRGRASIPPVAPVPDEVNARPFWSVMIPTHNCADLLAASLASVLAEWPGPDDMQVEVVDDCSTLDRPEDVVAHLGGGRVEFFRHPANVGISANFTTCIRRARGQWVHILHGDDLVRPGIYSALRARIDADPDLDAVIMGCEEVDDDGRVTGQVVSLRSDGEGLLGDDFVDWLFSWNPIRTPAIIVRRAAYEKVGAFHPALRHWADWDMWKRVVPGHRVLYYPRLLAGYRIHAQSDSTALQRGGADLRELSLAIRCGHDYLSAVRGRACDAVAYRRARSEALDRLRHDSGGGLVARADLAALVFEATVRRAAARAAGRMAAHARR